MLASIVCGVMKGFLFPNVAQVAPSLFVVMEAVGWLGACFEALSPASRSQTHKDAHSTFNNSDSIRDSTADKGSCPAPTMIEVLQPLRLP